MKQTILYILMAASMISIMSSCATSYNVKSDIDREADFSKYYTYNITEHDHGFPKGANPLNHQRIEKAIDFNMTSLGYTKSENADLDIAWFVKVEDKTEIGIYDEYYHRWRALRTVNIYEYKQGTLVIDIVDNKNNWVIWHGSATDRVYDNMPNVDKKIKDAVRAIFDRYQKEAKVVRTTSIASKDSN